MRRVVLYLLLPAEPSDLIHSLTKSAGAGIHRGDQHKYHALAD